MPVVGEAGSLASLAAGLLFIQALADLAATLGGGLGALGGGLDVLLAAQPLEDNRSAENLLDNSRTCSSLMNGVCLDCCFLEFNASSRALGLEFEFLSLDVAAEDILACTVVEAEFTCRSLGGEHLLIIRSLRTFRVGRDGWWAVGAVLAGKLRSRGMSCSEEVTL